MSEHLVKKHAAPLPRYTSYPTANHFSPKVGPADYRAWLTALPAAAKLSLYFHIPYCQELCWYCGCSTKAIRKYEPVVEYVALLEAELEIVSALTPKSHDVCHVHWGGGSPDILKPHDIERLGAAIHKHYAIGKSAEFAVEVDPRLLTAPQADSFVKIGVNRASIGVQDFDPVVQKAIGRVQTYGATRAAVELFRQRGIPSLNIDLVYGLPHQTETSAAETLEQVLTLTPDRVAVFGYAHLPGRLKHQKLIDEAALPGPMQRFEQSRRLSRMLAEAGYAQIGLDHFALKQDTLATKPLARNFQGYTTDSAEALIGFGASSISRLPQGFAQNSVSVHDYARAVQAGELATARGHALSEDDVMRAFVIEKLMCDFVFPASDLTSRFGGRAAPVLDEANRMIAEDEDGFLEAAAGGFRLTPRGRPFVRNICARFDAYLTRNVEERRHALSV